MYYPQKNDVWRHINGKIFVLVIHDYDLNDGYVYLMGCFGKDEYKVELTNFRDKYRFVRSGCYSLSRIKESFSKLRAEF